MTVYAYLRVSSVSQDEQNQRQGVDAKAVALNVQIDKYIVDKVSGTKEPKLRNLGSLARRLKAGDVVIVSELSRLSRRIFTLCRLFEDLLEKGVRVYSVKENFVLDDSPQSKMLIFCFGMSAEIEQRMISARTREALAYRKQQGIKLGRPVGSKTKKHKLDACADKIALWLKKGVSRRKIAKRCKVCEKTLRKWLKNEACFRQASPYER